MSKCINESRNGTTVFRSMRIKRFRLRNNTRKYRNLFPDCANPYGFNISKRFYRILPPAPNEISGHVGCVDLFVFRSYAFRNMPVFIVSMINYCLSLTLKYRKYRRRRRFVLYYYCVLADVSSG